MDRSTRLWLIVTMVALLSAAQLLERQLAAARARRQRHDALPQSLLAPLEPARLPRVPGREDPPRLEHYTVRPGDTLGAIAKRFLGSARAYPLLLELNADRLERPSALRAGMQLLVPDPAWLQRHARARRRARTAAQPAPRRAGSPVPRGPQADPKGWYTVQPGDTLGAIAQRTLGSVRHLPLLIEANRDRIEDPKRLRVGQRLRIPPRPGAGRPPH